MRSKCFVSKVQESYRNSPPHLRKGINAREGKAPGAPCRSQLLWSKETGKPTMEHRPHQPAAREPWGKYKHPGPGWKGPVGLWFSVPVFGELISHWVPGQSCAPGTVRWEERTSPGWQSPSSWRTNVDSKIEPSTVVWGYVANSK